MELKKAGRAAELFPVTLASQQHGGRRRPPLPPNYCRELLVQRARQNGPLEPILERRPLRFGHEKREISSADVRALSRAGPSLMQHWKPTICRLPETTLKQNSPSGCGGRQLTVARLAMGSRRNHWRSPALPAGTSVIS